MLAAIPESQTAYSVEVSSWHNNEDFFVEKTELHWSEQSGKHILLCGRSLPVRLVFLRLIDPTSPDRVRPVARPARPVTAQGVGARGAR